MSEFGHITLGVDQESIHRSIEMLDSAALSISKIHYTMLTSQYQGRKVQIKSTEKEGVIKRVVPKRGVNGMSFRMIVEDAAGAQHELMPHEFKIL